MTGVTINPKQQQPSVSKNALAPKPEKNNKPSEDKGISNTAMMAVGATALAAIVIAGFAIKGKLSGKSISKVAETPKKESELDLLKEQAAKLKEKIKTDYLNKRHNAMLSSGHTVENCTMGEVALVNANGRYGREILTTKDYNIFIDDFTKTGGYFYKRKNDEKQWISNFYSEVKEKLSELSKDPDWVEMRKMRKELIKNKKIRRRQNITSAPKNELERLELINEILYAKYTNRNTELMQITGVGIDDLVRLVKDKNTADKYNKLLEQHSWPTYKTSLPTGDLKLGSFDSRALELRDRRKNLLWYDERVAEHKKAKEELKSIHKQLASETRSSDDVQKLKELNSRINELSK